jgi:hypothetical protein
MKTGSNLVGERVQVSGGATKAEMEKLTENDFKQQRQSASCALWRFFGYKGTVRGVTTEGKSLVCTVQIDDLDIMVELYATYLLVLAKS